MGRGTELHKNLSRVRDPRISVLRRATEQLCEDRYRIGLPIEPEVHDEVDALGAALAQLARRLETRFDEIRRLTEVTHRINTGLVLDEVLDHIYDAFRSDIPYTRMGCAVIDSTHRSVRAVWARSDGANIKLRVGFRAPLEGSSLEEIVRSGKPRILNDLEEYLDQHPSSTSTRLLVSEGVRSSLTCPLEAMGRPIGFLFFSSSEPGTYAKLHADTFQRIADQVSVIVEKSRLYQELLETKRALDGANQRLARAASSDGLTGVFNRRQFDQQLGIEWRRAERNDTDLSLLMIDVDYFKPYNDTYGHQAGDVCLRRVATALGARVCRAGDMLARYGGEEFAVLLPTTSGEQAAVLAEALLTAISRLSLPHAASSVANHVTVSIGVATQRPGHPSAATASALVRDADLALYDAKARGRNCCVLATENESRIAEGSR